MARQQQYLVDRRSYATTLANLGYPTPPLAGKYAFTVNAPPATPPIFTITGAAQGDQALDASCTPLQIDQAGNRTPPACW